MRNLLCTILMIFLAAIGRGEPLPPDSWEAPEFADDAAATTLNWLPLSGMAPQVHTIHEPNDEDWVQFYEGVSSSFVIQVSNLVLPPLVALELTVWDEMGTLVFAPEPRIFGGIDLQWDPTEDRILFARIKAYQVVEAGEDVEFVPLTELDEPLSYELVAYQGAAPNEAVVGGTGFRSVILNWSTTSLKEPPRGADPPVGFDVLRRRIPGPPEFVVINAAPISLPENPGPCGPDGSGEGCVTYVDETVDPETWYSYKVRLVYQSGPGGDFTGTNSVRTTRLPVSEAWLIF